MTIKDLILISEVSRILLGKQLQTFMAACLNKRLPRETRDREAIGVQESDTRVSEFTLPISKRFKQPSDGFRKFQNIRVLLATPPPRSSLAVPTFARVSLTCDLARRIFS